jgi:hypothetical protein
MTKALMALLAVAWLGLSVSVTCAQQKPNFEAR